MAKDPSLSDFRPQVVNANQHTERGAAMLEKSIQGDGPIGAITAAADLEVFDGSLRLEKYVEVMPNAEPIVVYSDGTRPVVVVRTDIPDANDPRAKRLGVAANSIAAMDYNPDGAILAMLIQEEAERQESQIKQYAELDDAAAKAILEAVRENGLDVDDPSAEWKGMPEFEQNAVGSYRSMAIHFQSQEALENFSQLINQNITDKTKYIWFPPKEKQDLKSMGFINES